MYNRNNKQHSILKNHGCFAMVWAKHAAGRGPDSFLGQKPWKEEERLALKGPGKDQMFQYLYVHIEKHYSKFLKKTDMTYIRIGSSGFKPAGKPYNDVAQVRIL